MPWSNWTGSVHRSSKGETHPCDDGSSGQAQRHQQEGEQHGPEAHDSNRHWHHLQYHCQKISPWHLTLHPWCGSCQREAPTLSLSAAHTHLIAPLLLPSPHAGDVSPWSAQKHRRVAHLARSNQSKFYWSFTKGNVSMSWHKITRPTLWCLCVRLNQLWRDKLLSEKSNEFM